MEISGSIQSKNVRRRYKVFCKSFSGPFHKKLTTGVSFGDFMRLPVSRVPVKAVEENALFSHAEAAQVPMSPKGRLLFLRKRSLKVRCLL